MLADPGFCDRWHDRRDFLLVSRLGGSPPVSTRQAWTAGALALGIVLVGGTGLLPVLQALLIAAIALVVFGVLTPGQARDVVDVDVIILIAAAFGLAARDRRVGLAGGLASLSDGFGSAAPLLAVVVATIALTELITNNETAAVLPDLIASTLLARLVFRRALGIWPQGEIGRRA